MTKHHRPYLLLPCVAMLVTMLACALPVDVLTKTPKPEVSYTPTQGASPTPTSTPTAAPSPSPVGPAILSQADYRVIETVRLTNAGPGVAESLTLWAARIRSLAPYQEVLDFQAQPADFEFVEDEHGNQYALFEFYSVGAGDSVEVTLTYLVRVWELSYDLSVYQQGQTLDDFLWAETYVEVEDPSIQALADRLSAGYDNQCQTLRALYDYVGDNITYTSYEAGDRGALWALEQGAGDCTEFSDTLLALSRAAGIPARFLEGVTYRTGAGSDLGETKHDWLEAYIPGYGWVPLDPTWGRFPDRRDAYFGRISPDHIVVTRGRNLSTLGGYHYFYYNWRGQEVSISHQESWELSIAD
jgi:transglutaminase-like putative cysteine protease